MVSQGSIVLMGAGNMGSALLSGWLKGGMDAASVIVVDPSPFDPVKLRLAQAGVAHHVLPPQGIIADILFIAIKPQIMETVLASFQPIIGTETVVVSIAAGKTLGFIEQYLGAGAMVRAMPNTPAMIGRGITGAYANEQVSVEQKATIEALLRVCGPVEWVASEALIDAVTAVSGSGPAYVFYLIECMAEAGRKIGLPAELAMRLARATVAGSGELVHRSPEEVERLRQNVTSPGGTTQAALDVLMGDNGMQPLFDKAIAAARKRAEELAG